MHKSNRYLKLELECAVFSYKLSLKARKLFKKEKSCTKSEKLLEGLKVAPNLKICSKVAEQLMNSPGKETWKKLTINSRTRGFFLHNNQTNLF